MEGERGGGVGEVGGELGKSEKGEKEYGDTCVMVGPVSPSVEVLDVCTPLGVCTTIVPRGFLLSD